MLWILLLILVVVLLAAVIGGIGYRGRAGGTASPQTTIVETGRRGEPRERTQTTTVRRETEIIEDT
jgi:flagellar basal body-associated protein FliL